MYSVFPLLSVLILFISFISVSVDILLPSLASSSIAFSLFFEMKKMYFPAGCHCGSMIFSPILVISVVLCFVGS